MCNLPLTALCICVTPHETVPVQLERFESEQLQNDWVPGYQYQYDEDDFHFQPETITIMPTQRKYICSTLYRIKVAKNFHGTPI